MLEGKPWSIMVSTRWRVVLIASLALLVTWLALTPPGILGKVDAVGYAVCHRIEVRSFHIGIRQFSFCARCTGQFLGALLAVVYQAAVGRRCMGRPGKAVMVVLLGLFLAYAIDGVNSYLHLAPLMQALPSLPRLYEPSNSLRLLTGTGVGLVLGIAIYPAFNSTVWRVPERRPALRGLGSLGGLVLLALGMDALALLEIPWLMYVLAIVSALATLTLLGMIYTIIVVILMRKENQFDRITQLALPLLGGAGIAILHVAAIDLLRFILTGTWAGFPLE